MATRKKTTAKTANTANFDAFSSINTDAFKENFEKFNKGFEQVAEFQKESLDAVMTAGSTVAGTLEKISTEQSAFAKESFETGVKTAQALAQCKSPQEALDVNSEFVRDAFEKNMAQFNKMTELFMASGKEVFEPLTDNYTQFVEKVQSFRP